MKAKIVITSKSSEIVPNYIVVELWVNDQPFHIYATPYTLDTDQQYYLNFINGYRQKAEEIKIGFEVKPQVQQLLKLTPQRLTVDAKLLEQLFSTALAQGNREMLDIFDKLHQDAKPIY